MSNLIYGANGSMGVRYQAILKHLHEPYWCVDVQTTPSVKKSLLTKCERIILCTPTDTHFEILKEILPLGKPVLCEKPIVKSAKDVERVIEIAKMHNAELTMMFQYSELIPYPHNKTGATNYNYFRTGKDGLVWDYLQIIALSNSTIELKNASPIWRCQINGTNLSLSDMDVAYVSFVRKWLEGRVNQNYEDLIRFHRKTEQIYDEQLKQLN